MLIKINQKKIDQIIENYINIKEEILNNTAIRVSENVSHDVYNIANF